jgi:hypothetical protein
MVHAQVLEQATLSGALTVVDWQKDEVIARVQGRYVAERARLQGTGSQA